MLEKMLYFTFSAIVVFTTVLTAQEVCDKAYKKIGCFYQDTNPKPLFVDRDKLVWDKTKLPAILQTIICKCNNAAANNGFQYFAIRFWGECVGLNTIGTNGRQGDDSCKNGLFENCDYSSNDYACVGKGLADMVYEIGRNGGYSEWSNYGDCSATCGAGSRQRTRTCDNPTPLANGNRCDVLGPQLQTEKCDTGIECPVDGGFSNWSEYSICSASCGGGVQTRERKCNSPSPVGSGKDCDGLRKETKACNLNECVVKVDGAWGTWTEWSSCSKTCGGGQRTRSRQCNSPEPKGEGKKCEGDASMVEKCNLNECVITVNGGWGTWTDWSSCSKTCDEGERTRSRQCNSPEPKGEGKKCEGDASLVEKCIKQYCRSPSGVAKVQEMIEKYLIDWFHREYPGEKPSGKFYKSIFDIQKAAGEVFIEVGPKYTIDERLKQIEELLKVAAEGGSIDFARTLFGKGLFHFIKNKIEEGLPRPDIDVAAANYIDSLQNKIGKDKWSQILSAQGDVTLMFAMDTTGSMAEEIAASKAIAKSIIDASRGFKVDYILSPYNDPATGPVTYKSDANRAGFISDIDNLRANGGGDCPELAFKGMLNAFDQGPKYGSPMFLFTDASAKDGNPDNMADLKAAADLNGASITFFTNLLGCTVGPNTGIAEYQEIASYTSGQIFPLQNEAELLKFKDYVASSLSVDTSITTGGSLRSSLSKRSSDGRYSFPIDDGLKKIIITVTTSVPDTAQQVTLTDPSGKNVAAKNTMSLTSIFEIEHPKNGSYVLNFPSSVGKHEFKAEGISSDAIAFAHNFMYQERPDLSPPYPLYDSIQDIENMLIARIGGTNKIAMETASLDIVDENGNALEEKLKLDSLDCIDVFKSKMRPPNVPFKVRLTGKTKSGCPFSRISRGISKPSAVFLRPLYLGIEFSVKLTDTIGVRTQIQILNFGAEATFEFTGKAQFGRVSSSNIRIRRSGFIQLTYFPPSFGVSSGKTDRISITALDTLTGKTKSGCTFSRISRVTCMCLFGFNCLVSFFLSTIVDGYTLFT